MPLTNAPRAQREFFGNEPDTYLGDKGQFCAGIVAKLFPPGEPSFGGGDPETILKGFKKDEIIRKAFEHGLSLDELMPAPSGLSEEDMKALMTDVQAYGIDGEVPPAADVTRVLLQFRALDQVCAPPAAWSAEKQQFMKDKKSQLSRLLGQ